jgi:hypothetical protein
MHRVSTAHTPYAVDYAISGLGVCGTFIPLDVAGIALRSILMSYKLYFFIPQQNPVRDNILVEINS